MSTLKRSSSASSIPRLRTAVRQSNIKPPRSSSARKPSSTNSNLLTVYGSTALGRSSSYSNLATPSLRIQPPTPTSTSSASKNFRMNDKEWQKAQVIRVKHCFLNYDPEMPPIKPLCIRTYVHSMNILFKQLDSRITITPENYKDCVPDYLKSFKYPYNIKPSVVKSPAVPSNWQYVLQIWIWLIDLIELLQKPERVLLPRTDDIRPKLFYACVDYMADRFFAFNHAEDESKVDKEFVDNLARIQKVNINDCTSQQVEERLDSEIESLTKAEESAKATIQELTGKIKEVRESKAAGIQTMQERRSHLLSKIKECHIKSRNVQLKINEGLRKKENLEAVIAAQICTKAESKQLWDKIEEARKIEQLKLQCLKEQSQVIDDYNFKINRQKSLIQSTVHKTNNKIAVLSCKANELKGLKMPENLNDPNFKEQLGEFAEKIKVIDDELKIELETWKKLFNKKQQEYRMDMLNKEELDMKMEELLKIEQERSRSYSKQKAMLHKKIRKAQLDLIEKQKELEELTLQRPDIDKKKKEYEAYLTRQEDLKRLQTDSMVKAKEFFVAIHNTLKETIDWETEKMKDISAAVEKYYKKE